MLAQSLFFLLICLSVCLISSVHHFLSHGESFLFIVMLCTVVGEVLQALGQYRETTSYSVYSSQFYFAQQTKQQQQQQNQHSHNWLMHGYLYSAAHATKKAHSHWNEIAFMDNRMDDSCIFFARMNAIFSTVVKPMSHERHQRTIFWTM